MNLELNAALQTQAALSAEQLKAKGVLQLRDVLALSDCQALYQEAARLPYQLSLNSGDKSLDLDLAELASLSPQQQQQMTQLIHQGAANGFQYCFDSYRLSDRMEAGLDCPPLLQQYFHWLNSAAFLQLLRDISGEPNIVYCDAQVTRYRPGHFLTSHDDAVAGKGRVLALVFHLSPSWQPDWGGLLLFHQPDGVVKAGFSPQCNTLNLFQVPALHAVTMVAPFAQAPRIAITGWARSQQPMLTVPAQQ